MRFSLNLANAPRKLLPQVKQAIRNKIALLTPNGIRRAKETPLYKALRAELKEEKRSKGIALLNRIIETDKKHMRHFEKKKHDSVLLDVFKLLQKIDDDKDYRDEVESIVKFVWTIMNIGKEYDWLIECLLLQATERIVDYRLEGTQVDAMVKFTHGMSLSYRLCWYRAALLHFEYSLKLALPHEDWMFDDKQLANLIALELSTCAVNFSKQLRKDRSKRDEALMVSKRALAVLRQDLKLESMEHEVHAEKEFASCWADLGDYESALDHFKHAAALADCCDATELNCECLIEIGLCYHKLNSPAKHEAYIQTAQEIAEANALTVSIGRVALELMKIAIRRVDFENVEKYFKIGTEMFTLAERREKLDEIDELYGDFQAMPYLSRVVDAVLRIDKGPRGKNGDLDKFINWIDKNSLSVFEMNSGEEFDLEKFIKKYYDPDETVKIENENDDENVE